MNIDLCQRWRQGRDSYRPRGEPIVTADHEVAPIADDGTAKAFVLAHHYSGTYPAARRRFGLYKRGGRVGVAVFSHPTSDRSHMNVFDIGRATDALTLGRFVLLDKVPANGETWFLAKAFHAIQAEGFAGIVSFSDPARRVNRHGETVFGGHYGCVYQSLNARFVGLGTARTLKILPDGKVLDDRAVQKIRKCEQGMCYAIAQLVRHGAEEPARLEPAYLAGWLAKQLPRVVRRQRHPGNLRYAWAFGKTRLRMAEQPYLKPYSLAAYLAVKGLALPTSPECSIPLQS